MEPSYGDLILSHFNDKETYIVPAYVVMDLEYYHFPAIRFLFNGYRRNEHGVILNLSKDMIFELPVAAFLCAISKDFDIPSLIICNDDSLYSWHYYLRLYSKLKVYQLTQHNVRNLFARPESQVILVLEKDIKYLQEYTEHDFFVICVENLDSIVTSRVVQNLTCFYNIGLTSINPYKNRDQKLLWKMLKWVDDKTCVPFAKFAMEDSEMLSELVEPYIGTWMRLTWVFGFTKPTDEEVATRKSAISKWCEENNIISQETEAEKKAKKRKSVKAVEIASTSKRNLFSQNESNLKLIDFIDETVIDEFSSNWTQPLNDIKNKTKPMHFKRCTSDITDYQDSIHKCIKDNFENDFEKLQQSSKKKLEEEFGTEDKLEAKQNLNVLLGDIKHFFGEDSPPKNFDVEENTSNLLDVKDFFEAAPEDDAKQDDIFDSSDEHVACEETEIEDKPTESEDEKKKVVLTGNPELFESIELSPINFDWEIKEDNNNEVKETADLNDTKQNQIRSKKSKPFEELIQYFSFSPRSDSSDEDEVILKNINDEVKPKKIITKESILVSIFGENDEIVNSFRKKLMQREMEIPKEVIDDLTKPWMDE